MNGELVTLDGLVRRRAAEKSLFLMPTDASLVVPTSDVQPAKECELELASDEQVEVVPLVNIDEVKSQRNQNLSPEERAARTRALYAATRSLSGDPTKMIISKAEEYADMGVTIGAALTGLLAFSLTALGGILIFWQQFPAMAASFGLNYDRLAVIFDNLPMWLAGIGCLLYTSPSPRDQRGSRMPSSA